MTAPHGSPEDARVSLFQDNRYQVSQGGRYFVWYGCVGCHDEGSPPPRNLSDRHWVHGEAFVNVYDYIGHGHVDLIRYDRTVPVEQLWQLTAYVRSLPYENPGMGRRESLDLSGEPKGTQWNGALR